MCPPGPIFPPIGAACGAGDDGGGGAPLPAPWGGSGCAAGPESQFVPVLRLGFDRERDFDFCGRRLTGDFDLDLDGDLGLSPAGRCTEGLDRARCLRLEGDLELELLRPPRLPPLGWPPPPPLDMLRLLLLDRRLLKLLLRPLLLPLSPPLSPPLPPLSPCFCTRMRRPQISMPFTSRSKSFT